MYHFFKSPPHPPVSNTLPIHSSLPLRSFFCCRLSPVYLPFPHSVHLKLFPLFHPLFLTPPPHSLSSGLLSSPLILIAIDVVSMVMYFSFRWRGTGRRPDRIRETWCNLCVCVSVPTSCTQITPGFTILSSWCLSPHWPEKNSHFHLSSNAPQLDGYSSWC